jgi:hypothetical protein
MNSITLKGSGKIIADSKIHCKKVRTLGMSVYTG